MSNLSILFFFIIIASLVGLIYSIQSDYLEISVIPLIGLLMGMFLSGLVAVKTTTTSVNDYMIEKTSRDIVVYIGDRREIFSDAYTYNNFSNIVGVTKTTEYNSFGGELSNTYKLLKAEEPNNK